MPRTETREFPVIDLNEDESQPSRELKAARPNSRTRNVAIALSVFAALRILFFAAVFPLFNNVDEKLHFLTIRMYAGGHLPGRELPHIDGEFVRSFLPYWSPEYDHTEDFLNRNIGAPLYRLSPADQASALSTGYYAWKLQAVPRRLNFEAEGAPLYYVVAAGWYDLGTALGVRDWRLGYWLRLLNPISYGLLVWLSYRFVLRVYPDRAFLCLAVPGLIAVFPQDVFFGMNRDIFPPAMWAAALLCMVDAVERDTAKISTLLLASLLVGLTFLLEVSNCVLYAAIAVTFWIWLRHSVMRVRDKLLVTIAATTTACLPPVLWMWRNHRVYGDLTGSKAKIANFGWTVKPVTEMLHHPILTWHGASYFLVKLTRSIWHGDYDWHAAAMRSATMDWFYVLSSAVMILLFVIDYARRRRALSGLQKWVSPLALLLVIGSVLFLAGISMVFDYHHHGYPSQLHPFFVSGRIISGALLPFILVYATGLEWIANHVRKWFPPMVVLAALMLLITASEIRVRRPAFTSPYNFFAITRWQH